MSYNNIEYSIEDYFNSSKFSQDKINNLISMVNDEVMCDGDCKKNRSLEELYQKYIDAKMNMKDAPDNYEISRRNYYRAKLGDKEFSKMLQDEYVKEANRNIEKVKIGIKNQTKNIETRIQEHNSIKLYSENMNDLLERHINENQRLTKDIDNYKKNIFTNERKTHYIDESLQWKNKLYFISRLFIWFTLIYVILYVILYKQNYKNYKLLIFTFISLLLSIFITKIISFTIYDEMSIQKFIDNVIGLFIPKKY